MTYLDHAATTPMLPVARDAMAAQWGLVGNASSLHAAGRRTRKVVEESRESIARGLGCRPGEVVFTSGGTEANNLALKGLYWARRDADPRRVRILTTAVEHHAVLDPVHWLAVHEGAEVELLPVDELGRLDPETLRTAIARDPDTVALISVMWANNEVGTVQPIAAVGEIARSYAIPLHTDAVQAVGALEVDVAAGGVDALSLSGHKLGGPFGVGVVVIRRDLAPVALLHGGGQERDLRSGTLDAPAIAGLAAALQAGLAGREEFHARLSGMRRDLIARVAEVVPDVVLNGDPADRLPGNVHLTFPGCDGDSLLMLLDAQGIECSTGSACSAGVPEPSHVLLAMGRDEEAARGSLRFTLGHDSTVADLDALVAAIGPVVERGRRNENRWRT